jgi:hypothetical protein
MSKTEMKDAVLVKRRLKQFKLSTMPSDYE